MMWGENKKNLVVWVTLCKKMMWSGYAAELKEI